MIARFDRHCCDAWGTCSASVPGLLRLLFIRLILALLHVGALHLARLVVRRREPAWAGTSILIAAEWCGLSNCPYPTLCLVSGKTGGCWLRNVENQETTGGQRVRLGGGCGGG